GSVAVAASGAAAGLAPLRAGLRGCSLGGRTVGAVCPAGASGPAEGIAASAHGGCRDAAVFATRLHGACGGGSAALLLEFEAARGAVDVAATVVLAAEGPRGAAIDALGPCHGARAGGGEVTGQGVGLLGDGHLGTSAAPENDDAAVVDLFKAKAGARFARRHQQLL